MTTPRYHSVSDYEEPMDDHDENKIAIDLMEEDEMLTRHQQMSNLHQQHQQQPRFVKRPVMNELIMDYLVREGFKEAAECFREEAGIQPKISTDSEMDNRIKIRLNIEMGNILEAQSLINLHYPELLDNHRDLYFRLQQQHLIELIRQQKLIEVLAYVHDHMRVDEVGDLSELERTLALLAYDQPETSPYSNLYELSHRLRLASEMNDIILQESSGDIEPTKPKLVTLLKYLFWTQSELEKKKVKFSKMTDFASALQLWNQPPHGQCVR